MKSTPAALHLLFLSLFLANTANCTRRPLNKKNALREKILYSVDDKYHQETVVYRQLKDDPEEKAPKNDLKEKSPKDDLESKAPKDDPKSKAPKDDPKSKAPKDEPEEKAPKEDSKKKSAKDDLKSKTPKDDPEKKSPKKEKKEKSKKDSKKKSPKSDSKQKSKNSIEGSEVIEILETYPPTSETISGQESADLPTSTTPEEFPEFRSIGNITTLTESCPVQNTTFQENDIANKNSSSTTNTTAVENTEGEITYRYTLETVEAVSNQTELKLKSFMFEELAMHLCLSRRRLSSLHSSPSSIEAFFARDQRRRLRVLDLESSLRDAKTGTCEPLVSKSNTCAKYKGEITILINNIGNNNDMKETENNVIAFFDDLAQTTNWTAIDDSIVGLALVKEQRTEPTPTEIEREEEGSNVGTIVGAAVGGIALVGILIGVLYLKRSRQDTNVEVDLVELDPKKKDDKFVIDEKEKKGTTAELEPNSDDPYDNIPVAVATRIP